ncbi:hypothetical protein [Streptomyces canus]|uniref:hypothetical protein n=1 Tax=Streptomyces canus TaxID=58343 RepID=UPI002E34E508|nr:hypothetical protein [Streptomyces canus]
MPANELTAAGSYEGATLGSTAGPLTGSTAKSMALAAGGIETDWTPDAAAVAGCAVLRLRPDPTAPRPTADAHLVVRADRPLTGAARPSTGATVSAERLPLTHDHQQRPEPGSGRFISENL